MNEIHNRCFDTDKSDVAVQHDAGLIAGLLEVRKECSCWLITKDRTLEGYSAEHKIRDEEPIAVGIYTLINLLAINNGGVAIDPSDFAPLFSNVVKLSLLPDKGTFQLEDLSRILDIESQIADFSFEEVSGIAKRLHHSRILGKNDEDLSLQIAREFQKSKLTIGDDLDSAKRDLHIANIEKDRFSESADKGWKAFRHSRTGQLTKQLNQRLLLNRIGFFLLLCVLPTALMMPFAPDVVSSLSPRMAQLCSTISMSLLWFIIAKFVSDPKLFANHNTRLEEINSTIDKEIQSEIKLTTNVKNHRSI